MMRCLQLAKNGLGTTYPNPLVGAVVVYNDKIIGEGWHQKAGEPHAEVNAILSVKNKKLLEKATIYVNLEPCNHFGKTPPCSDYILHHKIPKVVVGCLDPNPKVSGKGIEKLKKQGCEVTVGVLEEDCLQLNKRFLTFLNHKRPFIILKWAQTEDGFIAPHKKEKNTPFWISNIYAQQLSHKLRAQETGILVGANTVLEDTPSLTTRYWGGNNPTRIIIDPTLKTLNHFTSSPIKVPTLILNDRINDCKEQLKLIKINFSPKSLSPLLEALYLEGIQSIIVEGGAITLQHFIQTNCWDEAYIFKANTLLYNGVKAPMLKGILKGTQNINNNNLQYYSRL